MAVCNLFSELTCESGNFLMFSQYVEDLTRNMSVGDNWKVVPSKFVAMNLDYSFFDPYMNNETINAGKLNNILPEFFQNYYENGCAYGKNEEAYKNYIEEHEDEVFPEWTEWNPNKAKNFFWNSLFKSNLLSNSVHSGNYEEEILHYVPEIVYYGDINMYSYNEHQGLGYGEIYCYIPSDANRKFCQLVEEKDTYGNNTNQSETLEGFNTDEYKIGKYSKTYFYNPDYLISSCNTDEITDLGTPLNLIRNGSDLNKYNINTIAVLYSIYVKQNDEWNVIYSDIPMGLYITGKFRTEEIDTDNDSLTYETELSNEITKHVTTSYDSGTSYGLRICTRFSATSNGKLVSTDITADVSDYSNICQMMTNMNENLYRMREVSNSVTTTIQEYKDSLSIIKNNRTNVPYIKLIGGEEYWFINGRKVAPVKSVTFIPIEIDYLRDELNYNFSWNTNNAIF